MRKFLVPLSLLPCSLWALRTSPAVAHQDQDPPGEEEVQDPGQEGGYTEHQCNAYPDKCETSNLIVC